MNDKLKMLLERGPFSDHSVFQTESVSINRPEFADDRNGCLVTLSELLNALMIEMQEGASQ